jgi:hypothetical protein
MRLVFVTSLLMLAACAATGPAATGSTQPGEEFSLAPGEEVGIAGRMVSLKFQRIVEDSRCPRDAQCVWEGNARIEILAQEHAFDSNRRAVETTDSVIELNTSSRFPTRQPFARWSIELRNLEAVPPFRATLLVEEKK